MSSSTSSSSTTKKQLGKARKRLLPHEIELITKGELREITHHGSSALFFRAPSVELVDDDLTLVYRPMGDDEVLYLAANNQLPPTQPYQAIIEGERGRAYAEKYVIGLKRVNTHPSTVVEFKTNKILIQALFEIQHKVEDGVLSIGLGHKAGRTLSRFNESLEAGTTTWRIVLVKRS